MNFWEVYEKLCFNSGKRPNPVGKELGVSSGAISQWKNGSVPSGETLVRIADYFQVSVDYLLGRTEDSTPERLIVVKDTIPRPPENPSDSMKDRFIQVFDGLSFADQLEIMNLTMQKSKKGA